jgi:hypothetical protein
MTNSENGMESPSNEDAAPGVPLAGPARHLDLASYRRAARDASHDALRAVLDALVPVREGVNSRAALDAELLRRVEIIRACSEGLLSDDFEHVNWLIDYLNEKVWQ